MPENDDTHRRRIGQRLKETREYLGFSQDEVAVALRIPRPAISLLENGERKIEALELKKLAKLYQQPVAYFIESEEEVVPSVPSEVAFLARAATQLTPEDQKELLRFAEFLKTKTKSKRDE